MESIYKSDVVVVGSGISGLMVAISLYPRKVTLVTKKKLGEMSSSAWAQGGIAAAVGADDHPDIHYADTIKASSGLNNQDAVRLITSEAIDVVRFLEKINIQFDKDKKKNFNLSVEAAHSKRRVLKINGDQSGKFIVQKLIEFARGQNHITFVEDVSVDHIVQKDNACEGIVGHINKEGIVDNFVFLQAPNVVLATGGVGSLYAYTTNPRDVYGEGIAMAARAGAQLSDMEFVQFHPTAFDIGLDPAPLLTEAIRGEKAYLVDENQNRFMKSAHIDMELAPRDVVAREIFKKKEKGRSTFLDCRHFKKNTFNAMFPTAYDFLCKAKLDSEKDLIPITPAAHYHMGGVKVDLTGKTSVEGLWACGETSSTGAHGANRLASNSLLEAFVFARKIAQTINSKPINKTKLKRINIDNYFPKEKTISKVRAKKYIWQLRSSMTRNVGLVRNAYSLNQALVEFDRIERESEHLSAKLKDMILVSRLITYAAIIRNESRGTHFRSDFLDTDKDFNHSNVFTAEEMNLYLLKKSFNQKMKIA